MGLFITSSIQDNPNEQDGSDSHSFNTRTSVPAAFHEIFHFVVFSSFRAPLLMHEHEGGASSDALQEQARRAFRWLTVSCGAGDEPVS